MKTKYGNKPILLFTYTDSLVYEVKTKSVYDNVSKNKETFDFINYSAETKYYDDSNALIIGKIKGEMVDVAIEEFVGLKPKMYSILVRNSSKHKKAKGVNKNVVSTISHNEYEVTFLN